MFTEEQVEKFKGLALAAQSKGLLFRVYKEKSVGNVIDSNVIELHKKYTFKVLIVEYKGSKIYKRCQIQNLSSFDEIYNETYKFCSYFNTFRYKFDRFLAFFKKK